MTPAAVSGIAQPLPLFSNTKLNPSPQEGVAAPPASIAVSPGDDEKLATVDTVTISEQSRKAMNGSKKEKDVLEESKKGKARREEAGAEDRKAQSNRTAAKVQFVYNLKGDLSVRYMDTANRLIYQVPSELMMQLKEAAAKSETSVNMNA